MFGAAEKSTPPSLCADAPAKAPFTISSSRGSGASRLSLAVCTEATSSATPETGKAQHHQPRNASSFSEAEGALCEEGRSQRASAPSAGMQGSERARPSTAVSLASAENSSALHWRWKDSLLDGSSLQEQEKERSSLATPVNVSSFDKTLAETEDTRRAPADGPCYPCASPASPEISSLLESETQRLQAAATAGKKRRGFCSEDNSGDAPLAEPRGACVKASAEGQTKRGGGEKMRVRQQRFAELKAQLAGSLEEGSTAEQTPAEVVGLAETLQNKGGFDGTGQRRCNSDQGPPFFSDSQPPVADGRTKHAQPTVETGNTGKQGVLQSERRTSLQWNLLKRARRSALANFGMRCCSGSFPRQEEADDTVYEIPFSKEIPKIRILPVPPPLGCPYEEHARFIELVHM